MIIFMPCHGIVASNNPPPDLTNRTAILSREINYMVFGMWLIGDTRHTKCTWKDSWLAFIQCFLLVSTSSAKTDLRRRTYALLIISSETPIHCFSRVGQGQEGGTEPFTV